MKKTLLNFWHKAHGANMAEFGGYEMPLWYASVRDEHLSVLTHVGVFDTSHMTAVLVEGSRARILLQRCFTRDLKARRLGPGRCVYGVFLNENGSVIDDAIVCQVGDNRYLCVINAGMGGKLSKHFLKYASNSDVTLTDLTDCVGKLDIQGPLSAAVLKKILKDPGKAFDAMPYFSFKGNFGAAPGPDGPILLKNGLPILLSRTGYTGEFGFEIFVDPRHFTEVWEMVLKAGEESNIRPCGLASRDSLRAGAVLPLSHQDIGPWPFLRNPWTFSLPYNADQSGFTKEFVGGEALLSTHDADYTLPFIGNDLRKIPVTENTAVLDTEGSSVGTVLTCVSDMGIGKADGKIYSIASPDKPEGFMPRGLSCGFVKVRKNFKTGEILELREGRRAIKVVITRDIRPARTARAAIQNMP